MNDEYWGVAKTAFCIVGGGALAVGAYKVTMKAIAPSIDRLFVQPNQSTSNASEEAKGE